MTRRNGLYTTLALVGTITAMAVIDYASGHAVTISVLYFIPIVAAAWMLRARRAGVVAVVATLAWLISDVAWRGADLAPAARLWNAIAGVVTFSTVSVLIIRARREHEALLAANRQLDLAVARESETARTDALTSLPNARAVSEEISRELALSRRLATPLSLLYIDLDDFKDVNDVHGHAAGDALLRAVAARLSAVLRAGDLAARIGGDEFVVLLAGASADGAKEVGARIVQSVAEEARFYPGTRVSASVGVTHYARTLPGGAGEMLSRADAVMYEAKHRGKARVVAEVA